VRHTGDVTIVRDLGVPRSTARGWLATVPTVVLSLDVVDLMERELRPEILKLRRRSEPGRRRDAFPGASEGTLVRRRAPCADRKAMAVVARFRSRSRGQCWRDGDRSIV
jgi:hypothetical protein